MRSPIRLARGAMVCALILPLAACLGGEGVMKATEGADKQIEAPRRAAFFGGDVVVAGPGGYCIDPGSVQTGRNAAFALLASCAHLGSLTAGSVPPAVITVSVLGRDPDAEQPSASRLAKPWANAGVIDQIDGDGISLIQLERGGDTLLPGGDPRYWRGAMLINGHVIGLAAYGDVGSGLRAGPGRDLLIDVAEAMLDASPTRRAGPEPAAPPNQVDAAATDSQRDPQPALAMLADGGGAAPRGFKSILSGLFRNPA
ncbi:dihydroxy-acid dehydratase [Roseovarius sp. S1116L3]|uniref:dihydroxy-acid dehydratase n=1 Tax=Roseovarius roseus TaxID=3342636 RepID=UPI00372929F3